MGQARLRSDLYLETWRRIHKAEVSDAEAARYLRRLFDITPEGLLKHANLPPAWPSDRKLPEPDSFTDSTGTYLIPSASCLIERRREGYVTITSQVVLGDRTIPIAQAEAPLDMSVPASRFMRPIDTPAAGQALVRALQPTVSFGRQEARIEFTGRTVLKPADAPWAIAMKVRLFCGDKLIATGSCGYESLSSLGHSPVFAHTRWEEGGLALATAHPEAIELELTGQPRLTLRDYLVRDTSLRDAWSGTTRVRPRVIHDAE